MELVAARRRRRRVDFRRRTWDALAAGPAAALARVPVGAARDRMRRAGDGLATALPDRVARRHARRRAAALREDALATASTCSTGRGPTPIAATAAATTRSCVAAIPFTPAPGPAAARARRRDARRAARACARAASKLRRGAILVAARAVPDRRPKRPAARRPGMIVRARRAVSLGQPGLPRLRRLSSRHSITTSARR